MQDAARAAAAPAPHATEDVAVPLVVNPEWDDVRPVPQEEPMNSVVSIAYDPVFVEAMDFFRAVLLADELSPRALRLTKRVTQLNPANYTAWHFRRRCLRALRADLHSELEATAAAALRTPKN